jgi:hypothetical protein
MAPQTPHPHEVPLESLHSLQNSGNHSLFSHSQWCTVYFSSVKNIVCCFRVISVQFLFNLTVLKHKVSLSLS